MGCQNNASTAVSDKLEVFNQPHSSNNTPNEWLIAKAIYYLNSADRDAEISYKNVIELLTRNNGAGAIVQQVRTSVKSDTNIQWDLLYLLGDVSDKETPGYLSKYAVERLPERGEGCEGPRDGEALLRTMAIHSLTKIAHREPGSAEYLLKIISVHPDREVLAEAVKGAIELGLKDKAAELLPKEDHWMINLRKARIDEVQADPERKDTKEIGYIPPKDKSQYSSPVITCSCTKGGNHHG